MLIVYGGGCKWGQVLVSQCNTHTHMHTHGHFIIPFSPSNPFLSVYFFFSPDHYLADKCEGGEQHCTFSLRSIAVH